MKGKEEMTRKEIEARIRYWLTTAIEEQGLEEEIWRSPYDDKYIEADITTYMINMDGTESQYHWHGECYNIKGQVEFVYEWTKSRVTGMHRVCVHLMDYARTPIIRVEF